ncbi:MAG: class I SAM-dependent methyltransferase [Polyangiaceae bacterium]
MGFRGVYVKFRPKQANVIVDSRRDEFAPKDPVRGEPAPEPLIVREEGVEIPVRLGDGLSTGIFLDQRENRRRIRELAKGASVANLFSYTCGFSVVAAVGGAWKTVSVDASESVLMRGKEAMERLGLLERGEHKFVTEDAFVWLGKTKGKGKSAFVDLLILDPPSYSTTKATRFSSDGDYVELAAMALQVIRPGGRLLACSNHRGIVHAKFRRFLREAATKAGVTLSQLKDLPDPVDFPVPPGESSHLKAVLATVAKG